MKRDINFINRIKIKENKKRNIISKTENDITISECDGRIIRALSKNKKKPPVLISLNHSTSEKTK